MSLKVVFILLYFSCRLGIKLLCFTSLHFRSDATLIILNSNYQEAGTIKFRDLFPTELTGIPFDATIEQQQYYTATAIFKYTMYDLIDNDGKKV